MNRTNLRYAILRAASLLAPADQRAEWFREWRSELWYVPRGEATRFCLGAFRDAFWLRRNRTDSPRGIGMRLESPVQCLMLLTALAAASLALAVCLSRPLKLLPLYSHLTLRDLPAGCVVAVALSILILPATFASGTARCPSAPRRWIFLAAKIALVQPLLLCVLMIWILAAPIVPFAAYVACAACILVLRWVFADQRNRCPVCLRLLEKPVRIGTAAHTFLEWHGAESMCSRGHGFLQVPETSAGEAIWLPLDRSWRGLFPGGSR